MKIAYLILTYKDPEHLYRLVNALKGTGDFYINVDKKSDFKPFYDLLKNEPSVHFLQKRVNVSWGGWSILKAYMLLLQEAFLSENHYERFVMLSGQDYPLLTNREIVMQFENNRGVEYIMAYNIATSTVPTDKNKVLKSWYFDNPFRSTFFQRAYKSLMYRLITKPFQKKEIRVPLAGKLVDPYFGQTLSAFTRKGAALLINTFINDKKFNKRMKRVFAPDELYCQTVIFNSDLRKNTVQRGTEHEITEHFGWASLHYHHYDILTSVFIEKDFDELKNSGYMFCRKVVTGKSDSLMDRIDEMRSE